MVANANLALAIALPVGIVALLGALVIAAWIAGRRRRDRTDPLEAAAARSASAMYPATHHTLYGKATPGSAATTTATATSKNTADISDTASGDGDNNAPARLSRNPFKDIGLNYSRSSKRKSYAGESLWDVELDEVLDDREWAPLDAGWRGPALQRQQQQWQHAQMRRAHSNGGYATRPIREGRTGDMPGTSSRMSSSESMMFGLAPGQTPSDLWGKDMGHTSTYGNYGSQPHSTRYHLSPTGSYSASTTSHSSRSSGRPPPNVNGNTKSRGPGSVHGGASSSTLRSLGTVPEVPRTNDPLHSEANLNDTASTTTASTATAVTEDTRSTRPQPITTTQGLQSPEAPATTAIVTSTGQ